MATVAADEGMVEADKANVQTAALNVEYTQIRSPVDGKTGPITVMPGNIISVTGTTATVNPLVTISQIQPIKISFVLPQTDLPRIQARQKTGGLTATIDQSDVGGSSFTVPVDFVSNAVNNATGTIELRATYRQYGRRAGARPARQCRGGTERYSQAPSSCRMTRSPPDRTVNMSTPSPAARRSRFPSMCCSTTPRMSPSRAI